MNYVSSLAILPNLVSGSYDGTIKIWNSTSFELIGTLTEKHGYIFSKATLSNSNILSAEQCPR